MATIYRTNGTQEEIVLNGLDSMQKAVGGFIELFFPENGEVGFDYFANEEGLLYGLPRNPFFKDIVGDVIKVEEEVYEEDEDE